MMVVSVTETLIIWSVGREKLIFKKSSIVLWMGADKMSEFTWLVVKLVQLGN